MPVRARLLLLALRAALLGVWLGLWLLVGAAHEVPVAELWPLRPEYQGDLLTLLAAALIYSVVAVQRRSRLPALVVFVPIAGAIYSCISFYRLAARWAPTGAARPAVPPRPEPPAAA